MAKKATKKVAKKATKKVTKKAAKKVTKKKVTKKASKKKVTKSKKSAASSVKKNSQKTEASMTADASTAPGISTEIELQGSISAPVESAENPNSQDMQTHSSDGDFMDGDNEGDFF